MKIIDPRLYLFDTKAGEKDDALPVGYGRLLVLLCLLDNARCVVGDGRDSIIICILARMYAKSASF